jgi:hypothetical protein
VPRGDTRRSGFTGRGPGPGPGGVVNHNGGPQQSLAEVKFASPSPSPSSRSMPGGFASPPQSTSVSSLPNAQRASGGLVNQRHSSPASGSSRGRGAVTDVMKRPLR